MRGRHPRFLVASRIRRRTHPERSYPFNTSHLRSACARRACRVEDRRGGGRFGLSVAPRFLWECLTSRTLTPFPVPAHRTVHADFPHTALGQGITRSHTRSCGVASQALPARGFVPDTHRGNVKSPCSEPCASHTTTGGAYVGRVDPRSGRHPWLPPSRSSSPSRPVCGSAE